MVQKVADDPTRLGLMLRLLNVHSLGRDIRLQRLAWQEGLTPLLLLDVMKKPGGCKTVQYTIHALLGRMMPPRCE